MIYKWKTNFYKTPASVAAAEMMKLSENEGLTAENLVNASRPEDAPLHKEFEWNDEKAAELFRQEQARYMIRDIIIINDDSPKQEQVRAFVHIKQPEQQQYEPFQVVVKDEDKMSILLETAKKELASFKAKYCGILEFAKLFEAIDEIIINGGENIA